MFRTESLEVESTILDWRNVWFSMIHLTTHKNQAYAVKGDQPIVEMPIRTKMNTLKGKIRDSRFYVIMMSLYNK